MVRRDEPHWYFIYLYECPVCGKLDETRERRAGVRPKWWEETHEVKTLYCGCMY